MSGAINRDTIDAYVRLDMFVSFPFLTSMPGRAGPDLSFPRLAWDPSIPSENATSAWGSYPSGK